MTGAQDGIPEHVHAGRDGTLFVLTGSNNVVSQYQTTHYNRTLRRQWRARIDARADRLRGLGIAYRHVVVPEKMTVYDDRLDGLAVDTRRSPAYRLRYEDPYYRRHPARMLNVAGYLRRRWRWARTVVDLVRPMRRARDREELFLRTDSHWSFSGCRLCYAEICRSLGARSHDFADRPRERFPDHAGDLGGACLPPRTETLTRVNVQRDAVRFHASPLVQHRERTDTHRTLHTGAYVAYRNDRALDPRRLLLFGDSYAHFAPIMLTIMLAETFREVHFVWSTSLDWGLIGRVAPDVVVSEIAERFMFRLPADDFDLDAYVAERFGAEIAAGAP